MAEVSPAASQITRERMLSELRKLANLAEASGDRVTTVKAMRLAWRVEHRCPAVPVPPCIDRVIEILEAAVPLARRFIPKNAAKFEARVTEMQRRRLELIEAERQNATLH